MSSNTQLIDTPFLDILPPPAPLDHSLWLWLGLITLVMLGLVTLYVAWQRRPRQQARRQLQRLLHQLDHTQADLKQALYDLNHLLCRGLGLTQLRTYNTSATADWQQFYQRLTQQQYRAVAPDREQTRQLIREALVWLQRSRP